VRALCDAGADTARVHPAAQLTAFGIAESAGNNVATRERNPQGALLPHAHG